MFSPGLRIDSTLSGFLTIASQEMFPRRTLRFRGPVSNVTLPIDGGRFMTFKSTVLISAGVSTLMLLGACKSSPRNWEIVADNQSATPCEVSMDIGPGSGLNAPDLGGGERRVLQTGSAPLEVRAVKVVWNRKQQVFTPRVEVPVGNRYSIRIDRDGNITTSLKAI